MERGKGREIFHKAQDGYNLTCSGLHADLSVYMYIQTCMFFCSATHSSSQTAGSIYAFMWSTAQSRARSQCVCISVYMCVRMHACTHVCVCVCVKSRLFPPWDLHKHTSHLPFEFHIQRFHSFNCQSFSQPIKALVLSLFIDQGWFKRMYVMWLEFLPWLIVIL